MTKETILITIPYLSNGGAEKVAANLSLGLSKKFNVYMVVTENKINYLFSGKLINLNVPTSLKKNIFGYLIYELLYTLKLFILKRKLKNPITISFMETANIPNILSGGKAVTSIHEFRPISRPSIKKKIAEFLIRSLYNKSKINVACSVGVEQSLNKIYNINKEKTITIYNPIIISEINNLMKKRLTKSEKRIFRNPVIISIGRLTYQKAQWHLIYAFKKVKKQIPNSKLVILGEGELKSELLKLCEKLDLKKDVYFLGYKKNPYKYLYHSSVFVLSSYYEGFGLVIAEAMACGVPVISVDCLAGPKEIISPELVDKKIKRMKYGQYGILIPPMKKTDIFHEGLTREENILADSIIDLLLNKSLRKHYSNKGRKRALDFDIKNIIHKWLQVINNIK